MRSGSLSQQRRSLGSAATSFSYGVALRTAAAGEVGGQQLQDVDACLELPRQGCSAVLPRQRALWLVCSLGLCRSSRVGAGQGLSSAVEGALWLRSRTVGKPGLSGVGQAARAPHGVHRSFCTPSAWIGTALGVSWAVPRRLLSLWPRDCSGGQGVPGSSAPQAQVGRYVAHGCTAGRRAWAAAKRFSSSLL